MSSNGAGSTGKNVGDEVRGFVHGIHGLGESLRGNVNSAADEALAHDHRGQGAATDAASSSHNQSVAAKGERELDAGARMADSHSTTGSTTNRTY
ncbi:hypothetical protein H2203_004699 [Taxawa tesnikishii (nom. ined.)]|nr:hypothetical protein H2203_004699 [Dothideales sp. JES 119]